MYNLPVHCNTCNVITTCNLPSSPFGATGYSPVILVVLLVKLIPSAANIKNDSLKVLVIKAEIPFNKRDNSNSVELIELYSINQQVPAVKYLPATYVDNTCTCIKI